MKLHRIASRSLVVNEQMRSALVIDVVHAASPGQQGLLPGVTNLNERRLPSDRRRLLELAR